MAQQEPIVHEVHILDTFRAETDTAQIGLVPSEREYAQWIGRTVPVHFNHPSAKTEAFVPNVGSATIMPDGMARIQLNSTTDPAAAAAASVWTGGDIPGVSIGHSWTFQRDRPVETSRLAIDHIAIVKNPAHDTFAFEKRYVYLCPALPVVSTPLIRSPSALLPMETTTAATTAATVVVPPAAAEPVPAAAEAAPPVAAATPAAATPAAVEVKAPGDYIAMLEKAPGIDGASRDLLIAGAGAALTVVEQAGAARLAEAEARSQSEISKLQAELAVFKQPPPPPAAAPAVVEAQPAMSARAAEALRIALDGTIARVIDIADMLEQNGDTQSANRMRASTTRLASFGDIGIANDMMTIAVEASNAGMILSRKRAAEAMTDPDVVARQKQSAAVKAQWANWRPVAAAAAPAANSSTVHVASAPKRVVAAPAATAVATAPAPVQEEFRPIGDEMAHMGVTRGLVMVKPRVPTW